MTKKHEQGKSHQKQNIYASHVSLVKPEVARFRISLKMPYKLTTGSGIHHGDLIQELFSPFCFSTVVYGGKESREIFLRPYVTGTKTNTDAL